MAAVVKAAWGSNGGKCSASCSFFRQSVWCLLAGLLEAVISWPGHAVCTSGASASRGDAAAVRLHAAAALGPLSCWMANRSTGCDRLAIAFPSLNKLPGSYFGRKAVRQAGS